MTPTLDRIDHIHLYVADRPSAERWYHDVLGFHRRIELESWAVPHGPLMLQNESGSACLALFQQAPRPNRAVIAFGATGSAFLEWLERLTEALNEDLAPTDHGLAWSIYFSDPDGNPFEITTYDYAFVAEALSR